MIISHKHKFIFIKTKKTAGTSLEIALSKFLNSEDIITPISGEDEPIRQRKYGIGCQNYRKNLIEYTPKDFAVLLIKRFRARKYWNHISAETVSEHLGKELFNSYYKFTIVRNPWDKAVSRFFWQKGKEGSFGHEKQKFRKYILSGEAFLGGTGYEMYSINGIPVMDSYVLYDELEAGLEKVSNDVGLSENLYEVMRNINSKGNSRPKREHYKFYYDDDTRDIVATVCAREISLFGFNFDNK